jgi:hypothetical protein
MLLTLSHGLKLKRLEPCPSTSRAYGSRRIASSAPEKGELDCSPSSPHKRRSTSASTTPMRFQGHAFLVMRQYPQGAHTAGFRFSTPLEKALDPLAGIESPSGWHRVPQPHERAGLGGLPHPLDRGELDFFNPLIAQVATLDDFTPIRFRDLPSRDETTPTGGLMLRDYASPPPWRGARPSRRDRKPLRLAPCPTTSRACGSRRIASSALEGGEQRLFTPLIAQEANLRIDNAQEVQAPAFS